LKRREPRPALSRYPRTKADTAKNLGETIVKKIVILAAGALAVSSVAMMQPANAGCMSGAVVGGVAGHLAGHHGLVGAGVGCAIGHHREVVRERERAQTPADRY
jgi:hypothetical protein